MSYYDDLGVNKGANESEIKKAYRKLAMTYHPDRNQGDKKAEEQFKKVNEAYAVLSDAEKRRAYDTYGDQAFHQRYSSEDIFNQVDFSKIFDEMGMNGNVFSQFFGGGSRGPARGQTVEYSLNITLREAYVGSERSLNLALPRGQERELKVKIPAGINSGTQLRLRGQGLDGPGGRGDLLIEIRLNPDPTFRLEGNDLECDVALNFSDLMLGCQVEVPTFEGAKKVTVPPGVAVGTRLRLKGLGMPAASGKGDLYALLQLKTPERLNEAQRGAIETLRGLGL